MKTKRAIPVHASHQDAYALAWKLRKTKRFTASEIARRLGLKRRTVSVWLRTEQQKFGAVFVQAPNVLDYGKVLRLWRKEKEALSVYAIARKVGAPESLVRYWIKKEQEHAEHS